MWAFCCIFVLSNGTGGDTIRRNQRSVVHLLPKPTHKKLKKDVLYYKKRNLKKKGDMLWKS